MTGRTWAAESQGGVIVAGKAQLEAPRGLEGGVMARGRWHPRYGQGDVDVRWRGGQWPDLGMSLGHFNKDKCSSQHRESH